MFICIKDRHSLTLALSSNRKNEGLIQIRARVWVSIQRKKWELSIPPPPLLAAACRPYFVCSPNFLSALQQQSLVTRYVVLVVVIWEDLSNRKNPKPSKKEAKNLLVNALPSFLFIASSSRIINHGCCCCCCFFFFFLRFFCSIPWSPCVLRDHCWVAGRRRRGRLQPHETLRLATESPRPICTKPALRNVLYIGLRLFCFFPSVQRSAKRREEKREIWEGEGRSRRRGRGRRNGCCCWRWQQKSCHGAGYQAPVHVSRDWWRASPRSQAFDPGLLSHAACWRSMSSCRCKRSRYCSPPVSQNLHLKFSRSFFLASSVVLGFRVLWASQCPCTGFPTGIRISPCLLANWECFFNYQTYLLASLLTLKCFLVPDESGKTTLLKILGGKHMVDPAMVRVLGRSAFHDTTLTSTGALSYLGGEVHLFFALLLLLLLLLLLANFVVWA